MTVPRWCKVEALLGRYIVGHHSSIVAGLPIQVCVL
jgi:hypothetical protein